MAISNINHNNSWWSDNDIRTILNDVVASSNLPQSMPIGNNGVITNATASTIASSRPSGEMVARWNMDEMSYVMKGEMVNAGLMIPEIQRQNMVGSMTGDGFKGHVKSELCQLLVKDMLKNGLIEFTMMTDPASGDNIYRARAYVMPNQLTKILREFVDRNT